MRLKARCRVKWLIPEIEYVHCTIIKFPHIVRSDYRELIKKAKLKLTGGGGGV